MRGARQIWIVLAAAVVYAASLSALSIVSHRGLKTQMNDLGNADQALWAAASGDLAMTQSNDVDGRLRSRIGVHANLIFWPLSLLYLLRPDPELLLVLTSAACAAAGLGLYAFARRRFGATWWAVVPPVTFWVSPIVHDANLYDFHVITVATALLVWCVWAFDARRLPTAWVLLVMALLCKEDVPLVALMLGVYLALSGSRRTGLLVMGVSLLYLVVTLWLIVPAFNEGRGLEKIAGNDNRYGWLGGSPLEIIGGILSRPATVVAHVTRPDSLRLPVYLLLCGGLAAFRAWRMLLLALPPIAMALLADTAWMTRITGTYYWITTEAVIILACSLAAGPLIKARPRRFPWQMPYLGAATLVFSILLSPLPHGMWSTWRNYALPPERRTLEEMCRLIPEDAAVCVQNNLGPHLSQRRDVAAFPKRLDTAEYALFHLRYVGGPDAGLFVRTSPRFLFQMPAGSLATAARSMVRSPGWRLIAQKDGFYLFTRGAGPGATPRAVTEQLESDIVLLEQACRRATGVRLPWARYLVGGFTWQDLRQAAGWTPDVEGASTHGEGRVAGAK